MFFNGMSFSFHAATEESTEASGEEITAVPPGKTRNNTEQERKRKGPLK